MKHENGDNRNGFSQFFPQSQDCGPIEAAASVSYQTRTLSALAPLKDKWFDAIDATIEKIGKREGNSNGGGGHKGRGQGRILDGATRDAIEWRAMNLAISHFKKAGYQVIDTSGDESYDLECVRDQETLRVEVKGSQYEGSKVKLTRNEVDNAWIKNVRTDLFVVGHIQVKKTKRGPQASGGKIVHHIKNWSPKECDLTATEYNYRVRGTARRS